MRLSAAIRKQFWRNHVRVGVVVAAGTSAAITMAVVIALNDNISRPFQSLHSAEPRWRLRSNRCSPSYSCHCSRWNSRSSPIRNCCCCWAFLCSYRDDDGRRKGAAGRGARLGPFIRSGHSKRPWLDDHVTWPVVGGRS